MGFELDFRASFPGSRSISYSVSKYSLGTVDGNLSTARSSARRDRQNVS